MFIMLFLYEKKLTKFSLLFIISSSLLFFAILKFSPQIQDYTQHFMNLTFQILTFLKEVLLIKKKLKREKVDLKRVLIFSSSLKRCKKLASQLSKDFIIDSRLKELNFGDWEMKKM